MTVPTVSCVVLPGPAGGAMEGIEAQRFPADRVEVSAPLGPVGFVVERALAETTGELVALAGAGDVWLPEKLRLQVAALADRPRAGAVHADVQPMTPDGRPGRASWFAASKLDGARSLGGVLSGGAPWTSTLVVRRSLLEAMLPLPAAAESLGAYIAARAAEAGELAFVPVPLARVRAGEPALEPARRDIRFLRWALGALDLDALAPDELVAVRARLDALLGAVAALTGRLRDPDVVVSHAHRVAWRRAMARAGAGRALGDPLAAARAYLAAGAADPFERHAREQFAAVAEAAL